MGRKRKAGALPLPILPSSVGVARSKIAVVRSSAPAKTGTTTEGSSSNTKSASNNKESTKAATPPAPTAPIWSRHATAILRPSSVPECVGRTDTVQANLCQSPAGAREPLAPFPRPQLSALRTIEDDRSMNPSQVIAQLLPVGGWRLGACWGPGCNCAAFEAAEPRAATRTACSCGHRAVAHELVDAKDKGPSSKVEEVAAVGLRALFTAIRNARAVGDCGLFEDSEGVRGWGAGWFLSRHPHRYVQQAKQAVAEQGGELHDPTAVMRCLATVEAILSGNATEEWAMPDSLPSTSVYQALGTGIASELDLAYWHARYSAASRFDAGGVMADAASSVVPPPEVYFVGLAYHVPSVREMQALPGVDNPALLRLLETVFDLPMGDSRDAAGSSAAKDDSADDRDISFPVLTNPLLAVTQSTWLETAISAGARSWVPHCPPRFGEAEGTMRGSDPALPPPIRARCDATRDWAARLLAFATPNRQAVDVCRRAVEACGGQGTKIVEVGAGLGYWKWVLEGGGRAGKFFSGKIRHSGGGTRDKVKGKGLCDLEGKSSPARSVQERTALRETENKDITLSVFAIDKDPAKLPGSDRGWNFPAVDEQRQQNGRTGRGRGGRGRQHGGRSQGRGRKGGGRSEQPTARSNEYHGGAPAWAAVEEGGPEKLRLLSATAYPVLLLCYPPPSIGGGGDSGAATCMGADAVAMFRGKILLYIGEVGGDTGSPKLEAVLRTEWDLVEEVELPCFSSTANRLMVFIRKGSVFCQPYLQSLAADAAALAPDQQRPVHLGAGLTPVVVKKGKITATEGAKAQTAVVGSTVGETRGVWWGPPMPMYRCARCGAGGGGGVRLRRCRLTRAVSYCSASCLSRDRDRWRAHLEARHVHVPATGGLPRDSLGTISSGTSVFHDKKLFKRLAT